MKRIYNIFIAGISALLMMQSCDLTLQPEHEVTPDNYFKTESDLMLWSNSFYKTLLESAEIGATSDLMMSNGISAYVSGNRNPETQSW